MNNAKNWFRELTCAVDIMKSFAMAQETTTTILTKHINERKPKKIKIMMTITFPLNLKEISMWPEAKRNFFSYKSDAKKPKTNNPKTATRQACQTALSYYITPRLGCGRAAAIRCTMISTKKERRKHPNLSLGKATIIVP